MTVVQVNVWTCEFCGAVESTTEATDVYSDPTVCWPEGWGSRAIPEADRSHPTWSIGDACPACMREAKR